MRALVERLGGRFLNLYYSFGEYDGLVIFEAPDEIKDFAAREWSTGRGAKVSAATEWPIFVDQAIACFLSKHRARSISSFR